MRAGLKKFTRIGAVTVLGLTAVSAVTSVNASGEATFRPLPAEARDFERTAMGGPSRPAVRPIRG